MNIFERILGYLFWGVTEKYKRFFKLKNNVLCYLGFVGFPLELITKYKYVLAGGCLRSLDLNMPVRDIDLFVKRKDFNESTVINILNQVGFSRYVGPRVNTGENILKMVKDHNIFIDIKIIDDSYTGPIYKLMDLTNCMISFGENGNLDISVDKEYLNSLQTRVIIYNPNAIPYYNATLNRLKKFEDSGWDTSRVYKYISDKERKNIEDHRRRHGWEGS